MSDKVSNMTAGLSMILLSPSENMKDPEKPGGGADGFSPKVTIVQIEDGYRLTITDKAHPTGQTIELMNGNSYILTAKDKDDIASLVVELIPSAESEAF